MALWVYSSVMSDTPQAFEHLGPALLWLRSRRRLKQQDVADRAGITKSMVSHYERAKMRPNVETLERLLAALDTDVLGLGRALDLVARRVLDGAENAATTAADRKLPWEAASELTPAPASLLGEEALAALPPAAREELRASIEHLARCLGVLTHENSSLGT